MLPLIFWLTLKYKIFVKINPNLMMFIQEKFVLGKGWDITNSDEQLIWEDNYYVKSNSAIYFDSFEAAHILKEIQKSKSWKAIKIL